MMTRSSESNLSTKLAALLFAGALTLGLAACGDDDDGTETDDTTVTTAESETEDTTADETEDTTADETEDTTETTEG